MKKYSAFSLLRNAVSHNRNWQQAWRSPEPKRQYAVIIVGGGGHGLATAYYLAKEHGIRNIAWPAKGTTLQLLGPNGSTLLVLPPIRPTPVLHKRQWWNALMANPAGYLDDNNIVELVQLELPEKQFIPLGPPWLRGWLPTFILYLLAFSLLLRWRWRLR